jgi:hypothetical protein
MKKTMTKEYFEKLSKEWARLDDKYDALFQAFLDDPHVKSPEEIAEFQSMQKRLYSIEDELYKIAEGEVEIV